MFVPLRHLCLLTADTVHHKAGTVVIYFAFRKTSRLYDFVVDCGRTGGGMILSAISNAPRHPGFSGSGGTDVTENCPIDTNSQPLSQFLLI